MKAYKGFNRDMTCRGFQYEEGKSYETDRAEICECGFHACEDPLECFSYYKPGESVYHEVELDGEIVHNGEGTKVASTRIKIGPRITIADLVKAEIDFVRAHAGTRKRCSNVATSGNNAHAATSGVFANAATSGAFAHAATSGNNAHVATSGNNANAMTSGYGASAETSGSWANAATTGINACAKTSGFRSHAMTSGLGATAITSGDSSNAVAAGDFSEAESMGENAIAVVLGSNCKARGSLGSWLVLTERDGENNVLGVKAIRIDGKKYKPDTWYALCGGKIVKMG